MRGVIMKKYEEPIVEIEFISEDILTGSPIIGQKHKFIEPD